jgi:hypothetical protein
MLAAVAAVLVDSAERFTTSAARLSTATSTAGCGIVVFVVADVTSWRVCAWECNARTPKGWVVTECGWPIRGVWVGGRISKLHSLRVCWI